MNIEKLEPKKLLERTKINIKSAGIYLIYCATNEKGYIGQTKSKHGFAHRFRGHRQRLRLNKHWNAHFQSAWNKYGEENFTFLPIEEIPLDREASFFDERETYYINLIEESLSFNKQRNPLTKKMSEETKQKISLIKKEFYKNNPHHSKGYKHTEEALRNMREAHKGQFLTEETKQKLSIALSGDKNPMYGKKHSEETRLKITNANLGRKLDEETKMKMSLSRIGKSKSEEHKQNISKGLTGIKRSEETLEKMRNIIVTEETREKNSWGQIRKDIKECLLAQNIDPTIENIDIEFEKRKNMVILARQMRKEGMTYTDIGKHFGLARKTVEKFIKGITWKYLPL